MRFSIVEIASLLHSDCIVGTVRKSQRLQFQIMQLAQGVCTDPAINTTHFGDKAENVVGPAVYLLKLLVRQYGFPCVKQVSERYQWIVPEDLRTADQVVIKLGGYPKPQHQYEFMCFAVEKSYRPFCGLPWHY